MTESQEQQTSSRETRETRDRSFLSLFQRFQFDDRVDVEPEISTRETVVLLGRSVVLLANELRLFLLKFGMSLIVLIPGILLPWVAKIVIDHVILQKPLDDPELLFPPFMDPIVSFLSGFTPLDILLILTTSYGVMLVLMGTRAGGTGVALFQGRDAATTSENSINEGGSEGGGIWGILEFMINVRLTQRIVNRVRTALYYRIISMPMSVLDDQRIGDSIYRVLYDTPMTARICYQLSLEPFFLVLGLCIQLYLISTTYGVVAPEVVWIALGLCPFVFALTYPFSRLTRRVNQAKRAAGAATTNVLEETAHHVSAVQVLGGLKREQNRFADQSAESFLRDRFALAVAIVMITIGLLVAIALGIWVYLLITDKVIEGALTPGDFGVFLDLYLKISGFAIAIGGYWIGLQGPVAAVRRVFFFLDLPVDAAEHGSQQLNPIQKKVGFHNVSFSYPGGSRVLENVNLELQIGEVVAIVGATGAGKTTLAHLIPGFVQPTTGSVTIDGQPLTTFDIDSLRAQVSYVFQEHTLIAATIRENLLLAKPDATEDEITEALETSGCMEFVSRFPDGIETTLGKSGETISVGQQQRLCIARGLIRQAPVLILDEPTAALDPVTEQSLVRALRASKGSRLVVIIAHRLSTVRMADRIVLLEAGEIAAIGSHDELMRSQAGSYRRFVELQQELL